MTHQPGVYVPLRALFLVSIKFAVFTEFEKICIQIRKNLICLSGIFHFCRTKNFRLSDSCPATPQKFSQRLDLDD